MTVLVHGVSGAGMVRERVQGGLKAEVFRDLEGVEALWRGLEAEPACLRTPYQRFDWIAAYLAAHPATDAPHIVVLRDHAGRPRILIPLMAERVRGVAVARVIGGDHANYHLPLFCGREAAAIPAEDLNAALVAVGREMGIDVYALNHQPRTWDGAVNPLALNGKPAPSDGYGLLLGPDAETTVRRVFSADARKKLRSKEKRLVEAHGPIAYRRAGTPDEAARFLVAFYGQKALRFAGMGIADPYAGEPARRFLERGATGTDPALEIHALVLRDGGRVLAVFGGAVDATRYSGMMTSFDADPEVSRFSPGDLLLHHLVREQTERGRKSFDLGVGEARYKASICDETIQIVDTMLPVTLRGHAYALVSAGLTGAKRRIKRNPRLFGALQRLRRLRAG